MATSNKDVYALQRDHRANDRLKYQVFLWRVRYGWSLPPRIPLRENKGLEVADVATGNGSWLLDAALEFPDARFTAFDISSAQFPNPEALPANTTMIGGLDIYEPLPDAYVEKFDVVHLRLMCAAIRNGDPSPILRNLLKMLKPGGYLAWGDVSMDNLYESSAQTPHLREHRPGLAKYLDWGPEWVHRLDENFKEHGLEDVMQHDEPVTPQWLRPWGHLQYLAMEEQRRGSLARLGADHENVKALDAHLNKLTEDAKKGIYTYYEPMIVSGRKPAST